MWTLARAPCFEQCVMLCRVAVVGNVDAGKSTMLGVLTHGELDNGRGVARQKLFRHKHEIETGRTSSVGTDILGFDKDGNVVNRADMHGTHGECPSPSLGIPLVSALPHSFTPPSPTPPGGLNWAEICRASTKVITFIDLAGHEKYLKTTVFGMTGHAPDFCMMMVGANAGMIGMTKGVCVCVHKFLYMECVIICY